MEGSTDRSTRLSGAQRRDLMSLGAVQVSASECHLDHQFGRSGLVGKPRQEAGIGAQFRRAVNAQHFVHPGHKKQQGHLRGGQDVLQGIEPVVARCIRNQQRVGIDHLHKARLSTAG